MIGILIRSRRACIFALAEGPREQWTIIKQLQKTVADDKSDAHVGRLVRVS